MSFDYKITDLKYRIDRLVPKNVCDYFIKFYEDNIDYALPEQSYKHQTKKLELDNFKCINLTQMSLENKSFKEPLDIAKKYISIMITNYVLYVQKICPTFDSSPISKSDNIRILKYEKNQFIKDHTDIDTNIRASCTLNLNENYTGGDFRFFNGQERLSFKTGDSLLFPAEPIWIHGTEPIKSGVRYSINCFLYS